MGNNISETFMCLFIVTGIVLILGLGIIRCDDNSKRDDENYKVIKTLEFQKSIEDEKQKTEQLKIQQYYECLRIEKDSMMCSYEP